RVRRRDGCRSPTGVVGTGLVPQRQLSPDDGGEQPAGPIAAADDAGAADSGQPGAGRLGAARVGDEPPARQPRSKVDAGGGRRPDTGLMVSGPAGSPAWAADGLPDPADELPGLVAEQRFAGPAQVGDTGHPEIGELTTGVAPSPSGPTTYVPILLYHYIRINPNPSDRVGFGLSTPPAMFRAEMQYLADHAFHVISLHQAVVAIRNHATLPSRPVVL